MGNRFSFWGMIGSLEGVATAVGGIGGMTPLMAVGAGIGLAAASGFRVFIPLLAACLAVRGGILEVGEGFAWMGSDPALIFFGVATVVEVLAFYVPYFDNLLDTLATPLAVFAGTVLAASVIPGESDLMRWLGGLVLGGGPASVVQASTVVARGASTGTTGGLGNPALATVEAGTSTFLVVVTLVLPIVAAVTVVVILFWFLGRLWQFRKARKAGRERAAELREGVGE